MSSEQSSAPATPTKARLGLQLIGGVLGFLVLLTIGLTLRARSGLRSHVDALKFELSEFQEHFPKAREPWFGRPKKGNAWRDYGVVEWVLLPRDEWKKSPPPKPSKSLKHFFNQHEEDGGMGWFEWYFDESGKLLLGENDKVNYETYKDLKHTLRSGLRRREVDPGIDLRQGVNVTYDRVAAIKAGAELLDFEALTTKDPDQALRCGVEILALANDAWRSPGMIANLISLALEARGERVIARALAMNPSKMALKDALRCCGLIERVTTRRALQSDRLINGITLATLAGLPISGDQRALAEFGLGTAGQALKASGILVEEWRNYDAISRQLEELVALPWHERQKPIEELLMKNAKSGSILSRVVPNVLVFSRKFDEAIARGGMVRMGLAAHLYRHEKGRFPKKAKSLARFLGGKLPRDPFRKSAAISYRNKGGRVFTYSYGQDSDNDKGRTQGESLESKTVEYDDNDYDLRFDLQGPKR